MARSLNKHGIAINASPTGTGKTIMALALARAISIPAHIVCPRSVIPSWRRIADAMGVEIIATNYENLTSSKKPAFGGWRIKGRIWSFDPVHPRLLIFDEAARLRGAKSQVAKLLVAAKRERIATILLSATLAESPAQMRAIGYALDLCAYEWRQWEAWCLKLGMAQNAFGGLIPTNDSERAMRDIRRGLGDTWTSVSCDALPDSAISAEIAPVLNAKALDEAYLSGLRQMQEDASTHVVALLRARQMATELMLPAVVEMAQDRAEQNDKVAVFVPFVESARHLAEKLKAPWLSAESPDRQSIIDAFQADKTPILVVSLGVGGEGVNLHGPAHRHAIILPDYSASKLAQALGRVRRLGGGSSSQVILLPDCKTGRDIHKNLAGKLAHLRALTDSDLIPSL
jgi:superfamily II DNA or RNA helicase